MSDLLEKYKTCGRLIYTEDSSDIVGSSGYLWKRNPDDHRSDCFEERKETRNDK